MYQSVFCFFFYRVDFMKYALDSSQIELIGEENLCTPVGTSWMLPFVIQQQRVNEAFYHEFNSINRSNDNEIAFLKSDAYSCHQPDLLWFTKLIFINSRNNANHDWSKFNLILINFIPQNFHFFSLQQMFKV